MAAFVAKQMVGNKLNAVRVNFDHFQILRAIGKGSFGKKGHLNCDPTFELEEMIVESKPLHKKKKRLAKQCSLRELQSPSAEQQDSMLDPLVEEFTTFNRHKELERLERERKENEWEQELLRAIEASGSPSTSSNREFRLSDSQLPSDYSIKSSSSAEKPYATSSPSTSKNSDIIGSFSRDGSGKGRYSSTTATHLSQQHHSKTSPDTKKSAWSKNRSAKMPEGARAWTKSRKS